MKVSPLTLATVLLLALPATLPAQDAPDAPDAAPADGKEIAIPEITYPKPETEEQKKAANKHEEGSQGLAIDQDELSADVQDLIEEQTDEKVIQLLEQVEEIMAEVIGALDETDTGGETIAAETEIIEKIFEAAQQRAQQSEGEPKPGSGMSNGAMLDMMERMMGREPQPGQGQQPGQQPGDTGGEGQTGDSDTPNGSVDGSGEGNKTERRFEKAGGQAGGGLPPEFQRALDAYNKNR